MDLPRAHAWLVYGAAILPAMNPSAHPALGRALIGMATCCLFLHCPAQWEQQWLTPWNAPTTGYESVTALATDSAGRYLVAGTARSTIPFSTVHGFVACFNADGALQWNYLAETQVGLYGGSSIFNDLAVSPDGNIAVVGTREVPYNDHDGILVYLDPAGDTLWTRVMESQPYEADNDGLMLVLTLPDTTILVAGQKVNGEWPDDHGLVLRKYDRHGQLLWQRTNDQMSTPADMLVATFDNICVTGYTNSEDRDIVVQRYTADGYLTWEHTKDGLPDLTNASSHDYGTRLAERSNGDVVVSGNLGMANYEHDAWIAVYDINGELQWEHQYGEAYDDYDGPMGVDPDGDIVFAVERETDPYEYIIELMKLDADGVLLWSNIIADADPGAHPYVEDMAFTSTRDIVICGKTYTDYGRGVLWICDPTGAAFNMHAFSLGGSINFVNMLLEGDACAIVAGTTNFEQNNVSSEALLAKYCTPWLGQAPLPAAAQAMAFPQPFQDGFWYSLPVLAGTRTQVRLFDVLGHSVWQGPCTATGRIEGLQHLSPGPYFLHWQTPTGLGGTLGLTKE